jgi:hypothetical protein
MATGRTINFNWPYPLSTDQVNVSGDIEQLAVKIDVDLLTTVEQQVEIAVEAAVEPIVEQEIQALSEELQEEITSLQEETALLQEEVEKTLTKVLMFSGM